MQLLPVLLTVLQGVLDSEKVAQPLSETLGLPECVALGGAVTEAVPHGEGEWLGDCEADTQPLALLL